jgi:hypothetical protein
MSSLNEQLGTLLTLYKQGRFEDVITQGNTLVETFSSETRLINILLSRTRNPLHPTLTCKGFLVLNDV